MPDLTSYQPLRADVISAIDGSRRARQAGNGGSTVGACRKTQRLQAEQRLALMCADNDAMAAWSDQAWLEHLDNTVGEVSGVTRGR